jgi:uncharacterized membrane protein YheB (UPF0754 family)
MKSAEQEAAILEAAIDARLKEMFHTQVTPAIEAHIGKTFAEAIAQGIFKAIDIDLVPRHNQSAPASFQPSSSIHISEIAPEIPK